MQIALAEFQAGTADYTTMALAQEIQLGDRQSALSVQENRPMDTVTLIGDLGLCPITLLPPDLSPAVVKVLS